MQKTISSHKPFSKYITLAIIHLLLIHSLFAQKRSDSLKTQEIIIQKIQQPTIADADKISESPKIEVASSPVPSLQYTILPKQIKTIFNIQPIAPAIMKGEPLNKLYNNYIKAGVGNYSTTFAEAFINNQRSRHHSIGAYLLHNASTGNINDVGFSGFSNNKIDLYGKVLLRQHALKGGINLNRNVLHYYGYSPEANITFDKENTMQRFVTFESYAQFTSYYKAATKINHDIQLAYYHLEDRYKTIIENNVLLNADFFGKFSTHEQFIVSTSLDYNNADNAVEKISNGIVKIVPQIISTGNKWMANVGLAIYADATHTAYMHFYPDAHFKYNVVANLIIPYIGVTGKMERNNFNTLLNENPFLVLSTAIENTNHKVELYGGVRGSLSAKTSFNLRLTKSKLENMPLFDNDTISYADNKFLVIYDDADVLDISGELTYQKTDKLKFLCRANYFSYDMTNELLPWHKPKYLFTITGNYDLRDKLIIKMDIISLSGLSAKSYNADDGEEIEKGIYEKKLKGIVDVNLGLEYRYTKKFSIFLNFNNIGAMKYYRWNNYPLQRFNVLGGLTYSF